MRRAVFPDARFAGTAGDSRETAESIADSVGIEEVFARGSAHRAETEIHKLDPNLEVDTFPDSSFVVVRDKAV